MATLTDAPVGSGRRGGGDALAIRFNPESEDDLMSLVVTATALMRRRHRRRPRFGKPSPEDVWPPHLSEREIEIVQLYAEGHTAASISHELSISEHTVRSHIKHAREKLHSGSITQAVAVAIMLGLVIPQAPRGVAASSRGRRLLLEE